MGLKKISVFVGWCFACEKDTCVCWMVLGDTDKCEIPVAGLRSMELFPHESGEFWTGGEAGKCNVVSRDDVADSRG